MNRFLVVLIAIFLFAAGGVRARAEESTGSAVPVRTRLEELQRLRAEREAELKARVQEQNQVRVTLMQERREEFNRQLQQMKDTARRNAVQALDRTYVIINTRMTDHFMKVLDRLTSIADKLKLVAEDRDNAEALEAIENIYTGIETARTAVTGQAEKVYTLDLADEANIGESASAVRAELREDLEALRTMIEKIRTDLRSVILILNPVVTPVPAE